MGQPSRTGTVARQGLPREVGRIRLPTPFLLSCVLAQRICLLTDQELDLEPFPDDDWPCDPRPFLPDAEWTLLTLEKESCVVEVTRAAQRGYDLFFNLCDGAWDEGRVGIEVVQTLEALDVPFTGADSAFFEPSREAMKRVCRAWGIDTPAWVFARSDRDLERAADELAFPLFVKHPSSYASSGLTRESRVEGPEELRRQARIMMDEYGWALIEEFIAGDECTSLVCENADDPGAPHVYRPLIYRFPPGESFKHYDLKWVDYAGLSAGPVEDPGLDARIREASSTFFLGMRGAGYGRCDLRVDRDGRVFMLEVNPNCGIYYPPTDPGSADLILSWDDGGHVGFTRRLVAAGLARHRRRQRPGVVLPRPTGDLGLFAARPIEAGALIVAWSDAGQSLLRSTEGIVPSSPRHPEWCRRYSWPLTDEIWVTPSREPEDWRPINHSCDPNAWWEGLDIVARRDIAAGEEITLEYATFHDERMDAFVCRCGSPSCRRIVRGGDHLLDAMEGYDGHFSDQVAGRRARRGIAGVRSVSAGD